MEATRSIGEVKDEMACVEQQIKDLNWEISDLEERLKEIPEDNDKAIEEINDEITDRKGCRRELQEELIYLAEELQEIRSYYL